MKETQEIELGKITDTEPKRDHGDISDLKASIREVGLINPITVNKNYRLLAGRRRFQAVSELGWNKIPVRILKSEDEVDDYRIAYAENVARKDLTDAERAACTKDLDGLLRKKFGSQPQGKHRSSSLSTIDNEGWSQEKTADVLGLSRTTVLRDIQIATAIEENPELANKKSGAAILRAWKKKATPELPPGKFNVIYADPPWQYSNSQLGGSAEGHYQTLSQEEIKNYQDKTRRKIDDLIHKNAVLFLWVTNAFLKEGLEICGSWGFDYKTNWVWLKDKSAYGKLGFYNYGQHEFLFIGIKGSFLPKENSLVPSLITAPKSKHSRKPAMFYELIESMYPPPYIELFSRNKEKRNGWVFHGTEFI